MPIDILQIDAQGTIPWVDVINVADTVRCKVCMALLTCCYLEFALVQADTVLDEQQRLIWE